MASISISINQWRALAAVVEAGSYAAAAGRLNKTQSAVSYGVQKLEKQLDVRLFEIVGRKAVLTEAGEILYQRARSFLDEAMELERSARHLAAGWEARLDLAVETIFPKPMLLSCLDKLALVSPDTRVNLFETVLGATDELLSTGVVDFAICSSLPAGIVGEVIRRVRFIAVAHPQHPLHRVKKPLRLRDLRGHRQLVVRDTAQQPRADESWMEAKQRWTVSDMATSVQAARMGLGYAWYPDELVSPLIAAEQLKPLPLSEGAERYADLYLAYIDFDRLGLAARHLVKLLKTAGEETVSGLTSAD